MARPTLKIDDIDFSNYVDFVSLKRKAHFFDKYAKRDISGVLHRELIGVYINYTLELGIVNNFQVYNQLWDKLTEPKEFHYVVISSNTHREYNGSTGSTTTYNNYGFTAYFADIEDEGFLIRDNHNVFKGLKVEFIAQKPHDVRVNPRN